MAAKSVPVSTMAARRSESAAPRGWPALLFAAVVAAAAIYAFSPRPLPVFPATVLQSDSMLLNGLAREGTRLIAAGELGHIVIADAVAGPWREASVTPMRGSTFTNVAFVGDQGVALAVGHDSWIVRSEDHGSTWQEVHFDGEQSVPLLGLAGPYDGRLFAFGGFGQMLVSTDLGKTWTAQPLNISDAAATAATAATQDDPFGNATAGSNNDRHLNAMTQLADGSLLLVGESGLLLRSRDGGASWTTLPQIYKGSFFGVLRLSGPGVLVFGMRGHAFYSGDNGEHWQAAAIANAVSLFGGTVTARGDIVLVGDSNSVLVSTDGGAHFVPAPHAKSKGSALSGGLAAVLPLTDNDLLIAGEAGMFRQPLAAAPAGAQP